MYDPVTYAVLHLGTVHISIVTSVPKRVVITVVVEHDRCPVPLSLLVGVLLKHGT